MAVATFTIGKQNFPLKLGIYLIRGANGRIPKEGSEYATELYLDCQDESVEDKHALIFVENVELSVLDLQTKSGTYLAGKDGVFKRLPSMQKVTVTNFQTLRFGELSGGALRLCTAINQQHSSGFHDSLDSSHISSSTANDSDKRDSFNIPETQVHNVSLLDKGENEKNETNDNNASIPETQLAPIPVDALNVGASTQDISQFVICTQEFNATCDGALDQCSDDLLQNFDWLEDHSQATTVAAKLQLTKDKESASKTAVDCSSIEMDALNWSNTTASKNESVAKSQCAERSESTTPDLFEPYETSSNNFQNKSKQNSTNVDIVNQPENNVDLSTTGTSVPNLTKNTSMSDLKVISQEVRRSLENVDSADDQPLQQSNKENMEDCEAAENDDQPLQQSNKENMEDCEAAENDLDPTQLFVPKNANILILGNQLLEKPKLPEIPDADLLPTQVFISKQDKIIQSSGASCKSSTSSSMDLEPTQIFLPKHVAQHQATSTPMRFKEQITKIGSEAVSQIPKPSVENFFGNVEKSLHEEETSDKETTPNCEEAFFDISSPMDTELLMKTPKMIADVFNSNTHSSASAKGRNILDTLSIEADCQDTLKKTNAIPQGFDNLIASIRKQSMNCTDVNQLTSTVETVKDVSDIAVKTDKGSILESKKKSANPKGQKTKGENTDKPYSTVSVGEKDYQREITTDKKSKSAHRKRKTEKSPESGLEEKNTSSKITDNTRTTKTARSTRSTKETMLEDSVPNHSKSKKLKREQSSSDSTARSEKLEKNVRKERKESKDVEISTNTNVTELAPRRRGVRKTSQSESLTTSTILKSDSNSSVITTSSKRSSRSRITNECSRVTRRESRCSEKTPAISQLGSIVESNIQDRVKTDVEEAKPEKIEKSKKRKKEPIKDESDQPTTSKTKKTENPLQISFTMVQPDKQQELIKKAKNLWTVAKTPKDSKMLVMDVGSRTVKFLIAMAKGTPIVTTKWVEAFNASGVPSMSSELIFKDKQFEQEFKFSILRTLEKACSKRIFENLNFVMTDKILPQPSDMKEIIQCAGGTIYDEIPKSSTNLFLISSKDDSRLWHSFRRKHEDICITSTEAVMLAIMRYEVKLLQKLSF